MLHLTLMALQGQVRGTQAAVPGNSQKHLFNSLCTQEDPGEQTPKCTPLAAIAAPAGTPTLAVDSPFLPFVETFLPK